MVHLDCHLCRDPCDFLWACFRRAAGARPELPTYQEPLPDAGKRVWLFKDLCATRLTRLGE